MSSQRLPMTTKNPSEKDLPSPAEEFDRIRIQKWLSQLGVASRRQAESWISAGRIAINGQVLTEQGHKINPSEDQVTLDGKLIQGKAPPRVYWLLHKPDQTLTSRPDDSGRPTIYDLPNLKKLKFQVPTVGRLDFRTEGLLLLTNDGKLAHRLMHPSYKMPREYHALVTGKLTDAQIKAIRAGLTLEDGPTQPVKLRYAHGRNLGQSRGSWYVVTVTEGRNRLVRRLFEYFDERVVRLIRVGFGTLRLPEELSPGDYRQLNSDEIRTLKSATQL